MILLMRYSTPSPSMRCAPIEIVIKGMLVEHWLCLLYKGLSTYSLSPRLTSTGRLGQTPSLPPPP